MLPTLVACFIFVVPPVRALFWEWHDLNPATISRRQVCRER
ncbi:hypothetical protein [Belnapia moabensis]|nr:hypothetical protein [Belnapia moabensis]